MSIKSLSLILPLLILGVLVACPIDPEKRSDPSSEQGPDSLQGNSDSFVHPGAVLWFFGDSHTAGRSGGAVSNSPANAFLALWDKNIGGSRPSSVIDGTGGCSLSDSRDRYMNRENRSQASYFHFQESGNQNWPGQTTAAEFKVTFKDLMRLLSTESPQALLSYETAYSFQREHQDFRNWTDWNTVLFEAVDELKTEGIGVYLCDSDRAIKAYVARLGFSSVITDDGGHFRENGNLLIALCMYKTLGADVSNFDLSDIPEEEVSRAHKDLAVEIACSL